MSQPTISTPNDYQSLLTLLVEKGMLNPKDSVQALRLSKEERNSVTRLLVKLGWVSEQELAMSLSQCCGCPIAEEDDYPSHPVFDPNISLRFMQNYKLIPSRNKEGELLVIMSDPIDKSATSALRLICDTLPEIKVGIPSLIEQSISTLYGEGQSSSDNDSGIDDLTSEEDIKHLKDLASEAPIIKLVNKVIQKAVEAGASDVHIEPFEKTLKIRYRIDGILSEEDAPPTYSSAAIISRVKIMSSLDIAERRLPQDGRIMVRSHGKTLDVRVSTLPTVYGESVVMRILDRESLELNFSSLGFDTEVLPSFLEALDLPHGIILVTGPTGSGKSTTLYTAISHLNSPKVKIITVEDPVEYQIEGVNQLPVKASIGLDFATALRSIVRQDPDIIMIGEMRDVETAQIAIQSALTGHLVLSTLHTNSAAAGITRLIDMGIKNYLLTSTINGILGQRLVRKLCNQCKEAYKPSIKQLKILEDVIGDTMELYRPKGCTACNHKGYSGRMMIIEWLPMTENLQALIMADTGATTLHKRAVEDGMITMFKDGLFKVVAGETCIDEILRVTQES
ncbi:MAG: general secretion pathway protein E [Candidatus Endobugula sp.]|jgi:general secretion pathway protein E